MLFGPSQTNLDMSSVVAAQAAELVAPGGDHLPAAHA